MKKSLKIKKLKNKIKKLKLELENYRRRIQRQDGPIRFRPKPSWLLRPDF